MWQSASQNFVGGGANKTNSELGLVSSQTLQVQLMSRDEQSVLVVTYAELKHCLEQSFGELMAA